MGVVTDKRGYEGCKGVVGDIYSTVEVVKGVRDL
jgi:hypothetical protein